MYKLIIFLTTVALCVTGCEKRSANGQPATVTPAKRTPQAGDLIKADPIVGNLRYVPSGVFTQGSPVTEPGRNSNEAQFIHNLTRNIAVMETEVTRQMWATLRNVQSSLPADPSALSGTNQALDVPVQQIPWDETILFANLLSLHEGLTPCYYSDASYTKPIARTDYKSNANFAEMLELKSTVYCNWSVNGYRLPSEGEWEYFCRAGSITPFSVVEPNYSSSNCATSNPSPTLSGLDKIAWWSGNSNATSPVGKKAANQWNLMDVHGNVWEWCWDWDGEYKSGSVTDYFGPDSGTQRIIRGGSYAVNSQYCRSSFRFRGAPEGWNITIGFRLVRSL